MAQTSNPFDFSDDQPQRDDKDRPRRGDRRLDQDAQQTRPNDTPPPTERTGLKAKWQRLSRGKKIGIISGVVILVLGICGQLGMVLVKAYKRHAARNQRVSRAIEEDILVLNGKRFHLPVKTSALVEQLGQPERRKSAIIESLTWDSLGITAMQQLFQTENVNTLIFRIGTRDAYFGKSESEATWPCVLVIDGATIDDESTIDEINRVKSGKKFTRNNRFAPCWRVEYDSIFIEIWNPDDKIESVAIGLKSK